MSEQQALNAALDEAFAMVRLAAERAPKEGVLQTAQGLIGTRDIFNLAGQIYASRMGVAANERLVEHLVGALTDLPVAVENAIQRAK
jgi:hypothetical protein